MVGPRDSSSCPLARPVLSHTDSRGIDCIIDNLGLAELWNGYRPAVATMGRIVVSGAIGQEPIAMQLLPFYLHSQSLIGVRTGNRAQMRALWEDVRAGFRLPSSVVVQRPWGDMHDVHELVQQGNAIGQTVLEVPTS